MPSSIRFASLGMDLVPTIDVAEPTTASLEALDSACADHGFFLLAHRLGATVVTSDPDDIKLLGSTLGTHRV